MSVRKKMTRSERAKQFVPFAALKGYSEALRRAEEEALRNYEEEDTIPRGGALRNYEEETIPRRGALRNYEEETILRREEKK